MNKSSFHDERVIFRRENGLSFEEKESFKKGVSQIMGDAF